METTPQQISATLTQAEISRHLALHICPALLEKLEKRALKEHPPVFRCTVPVPPDVRNVAIIVAKQQSKLKKINCHDCFK